MRHLRRNRRQHAGQERRAGARNHRQPVRGRGLSKPGHPHQGQCAHAARAAAGRPQPVLQGLARGLALPPGQALERAPRRLARGLQPRIADFGALRGALLRLHRLHRNRAHRTGHGRHLQRHRTPALVDQRGPSTSKKRAKAPRAWPPALPSSSASCKTTAKPSAGCRRPQRPPA